MSDNQTNQSFICDEGQHHWIYSYEKFAPITIVYCSICGRHNFTEMLTDHDNEIITKIVNEIVSKIRSNCTLLEEAYAIGGDHLIKAVSDWIENPPEWVNASWIVSTDEKKGL